MSATTSTLNQETRANSRAAGLSQNHSSGSVVSPYFPSSANSQTVKTDPVPVSSQAPPQTEQTVITTTQPSHSVQDTTVSVIQTVAAQMDRSCVLVGDMTWVS